MMGQESLGHHLSRLIGCRVLQPLRRTRQHSRTAPSTSSSPCFLALVLAASSSRGSRSRGPSSLQQVIPLGVSTEYLLSVCTLTTFWQLHGQDPQQPAKVCVMIRCSEHCTSAHVARRQCSRGFGMQTVCRSRSIS